MCFYVVSLIFLLKYFIMAGRGSKKSHNVNREGPSNPSPMEKGEGIWEEERTGRR
jgi:hypothetical protein